MYYHKGKSLGLFGVDLDELARERGIPPDDSARDPEGMARYLEQLKAERDKDQAAGNNAFVEAWDKMIDQMERALAAGETKSGSGQSSSSAIAQASIGIPTWVWLAVGAIALYLYLKSSGGSYDYDRE
jgi:hypothetical protein